MKYSELRELALTNSLANYICNLDELQDEGKTADEILEMVEQGDSEVVIWEPFEDWEPSSIESEVINLQLSNIREYESLLKSVMGDDMFNAWKEA